MNARSDDAVRARLRAAMAAAGTNQTALSRRLGRGKDYVGDFLRGKTVALRSAEASAIEEQLGIAPGGLLRGEPRSADAGQKPEAIYAGPSSAVVRVPAQDRLFSPAEVASAIGGEIPVYAAVEGGAGEMIVERDPIDYVPRPRPLQGVRGGYLVHISGESMVPAFRPGEQAIVHPKLPPVRDEAHIFYTADSNDDRATIKHLVRMTADAWNVEQFNPARLFDLDRHLWTVCHRVVGKYSRR